MLAHHFIRALEMDSIMSAAEETLLSNALLNKPHFTLWEAKNL